MKRNDGHVTTPDLTLPVVGPKREDVEEIKEIENAAFYASCESDDNYAELTAVAHELRAKHKALTAERDAIIKPINAAVTRIRTMYKPTLESLDASCNRIKMIMMGYQQKLTERRSMAELKARQALIMGDHATLIKHTAEAVQQPAFAGSHTRKTWKLRITDVEKVPRQFLTVDTVALKRYAIAHGWQDAPEGVEFYQEEGIALR